MGEINNAMCSLLEVQEYFREIWQVTKLLGECTLDGKLLCRDNIAYYKRCLKKGNIQRDVLMRHDGRLKCILGIKILETIDYTISARIMDYDSQEMKRQLNDIAHRNRYDNELIPIKWEHGGEFLYGVKKQDRIMPVKTMGLYCGWEPFDGARNVSELYDAEQIPQENRDVFPSYPVSVINLRELDENDFETGLRELIGVFKRSKDKQALKEYYSMNKERFSRLDDFIIDAMAALIGENKIKQFKQEGRGIDMCKAFEDERNEGREEGCILTILKLVEKGRLSMEAGAEEIERTVIELEKLMVEKGFKVPEFC